MQLFYKIIYQKNINFLLRNFSYILRNILPDNLKISISGILKLKTKVGTLKILTNQTSYLTKILFWNGYKSFEYSEIFENLSKNANCFLDIGANIGYYSLLAAKSNPTIKVFAFEPALGPKYYLNKNISINNLQNNIKALDYALSDKEGIIDFYEVENLKYKNLTYNLSGEHNTGTKKTSRNFKKSKVEAKTLKSFFNEQNFKKVDLIKIDTEGTEAEILKSSITELKLHQPIIICETLFNTTENELDDFFSLLDYVFYNHTNKGLVKVNSIKREKDNGIRNCFFVPKTKIHLISNYISKI